MTMQHIIAGSRKPSEWPLTPQNKSCGPSSLLPHGFGLSVGAAGDAGLPGVRAGLSGTASDTTLLGGQCGPH